MIDKEQKASFSAKPFDPKKSIQRAKKGMWTLKVVEKKYKWATKMDRVTIIREGLPYDSIEVISKKSDLPIKQILNLLGLPQTTYNKKKKEKGLLSGRDSEIVLVLSEVLEYGLQVFNEEKDKFHRWLKKPNISLGGTPPETLFDSLTGIQEVRNSLNRLEYGNLA